MLRASFLRIGLGAIFAALLLAALGVVLPGSAAAQEARSPISLSVAVSGSTIDYTVDNIANRRDTFPVIPGECTTVLVDTVAAAPALGPAAVDILGGHDSDTFALLQRLVADGAVTAGPRIQFASATGQVAGSFTDVPRGIYLVATVSALDPFDGAVRPELIDIVPAVVPGPSTTVRT